MKDLYKILQIDPAADHDVVKAAYRALVKKHQGDDRAMVALNEANEIIADADRRKAYDSGRAPKGRRLGGYTLLEKIAEGGFGETWKAKHVATGALACVKIAIEASSEDQAFLLEEGANMWELRHYGIPALRDVVRTDDDKIALVMSYIPGPTLAQVIENNYPNGMDPEHVAWIAERCLNVLKYIHVHGIIHGDMKPQNIIVEPEKHTIVLVDWGLSCIKPTHKTEAKGYTPYFCAPEQVGDKPPLPATDLYGLGMTIIFALGGDVEHVKVPSSTPDHMRAFIKELVRLDPMRRPQVWDVDLCETIKEVRQKDFGRTASGMKPLKT